MVLVKDVQLKGNKCWRGRSVLVLGRRSEGGGGGVHFLGKINVYTSFTSKVHSRPKADYVSVTDVLHYLGQADWKQKVFLSPVALKVEGSGLWLKGIFWVGSGQDQLT